MVRCYFTKCAHPAIRLWRCGPVHRAVLVCCQSAADSELQGDAQELGIGVLVGCRQVVQEKAGKYKKDAFTSEEARRQFETVVDWGRYAQLFEYDADEERLYKVEEEPAEAMSEKHD